MTKYYDTSDGTRLAYHDQGKGIPLLCLAGLTRNSTDFDYVAPSLKHVRLIRLDYRGRGQSQWAGHETYTIQKEAQDVLELLDHLKLDKVNILGTSRGGLISMVLAVVAKQRLSGVCLNDIGPELSPEGLRDIMTYLGRRPPQKNYEDVAVARAEFMDGFKNVAPSRWLEEANKHYVETDKGLGINYDPLLRRAVEEGSKLPTPNLWPLFDSFAGLPLALIRGANSNLLTVETAKEMCRRRPDMIFGNVPDRGHVPFLDEAVSQKVLNEFLRVLL